MSMSLPRLTLGRFVPGKLSVPKLPRLAGFNGTGAAGPRRILAIVGGGVAVMGVLVGATFIGSEPPVVSQPGRLPAVNPLPGGVRSTPHQDMLALRSNQEAAAKVGATGQSFTPQIVASQPYSQPAAAQPLLTSPRSAPAPAAAPAPAPAPVVPVVTPAVATTGAPEPAARAMPASAPQGSQVHQVQAQGRTDADDARYRAAIERVMGGWGGRPPRTDVILPPDLAQDGGDAPRGGPAGAGRSAADSGPVAATPAAAGTGRMDRQRVLIPAGRGIYAHTILAASSDAQSPVVLEADSGPVAGARLIGSFSREAERLVIRGSRIALGGREINAEWIVVSPATMEAGVASSVDQHYVSRFVLPAAAAFVQGLGQAVQLSDSAVTTSPFGGLTAFQRLNPTQQLGVAAGVAAGRVGQALDQAAPKGPTVKLDVGSSVGVMFLTNVAVPE